MDDKLPMPYPRGYYGTYWRKAQSDKQESAAMGDSPMSDETFDAPEPFSWLQDDWAWRGREIEALRAENRRLRTSLDVHLDLCGEQAAKIMLLERELRGAGRHG